MKRIILLISSCFLVLNVFAQYEENDYEARKEAIPNIVDTGNILSLRFMNKNWSIKKGDRILIYLPAGGKANYMFVKKKEGMLNTKLLGQVSDIVATGALAAGIGLTNIKLTLSSIELMNKASAISYGADALNKINELNISRKAKKIAGKKAKILYWKIIDGDYIVYVKIGKKKYEVNYTGAILTNEVKIIQNRK